MEIEKLLGNLILLFFVSIHVRIRRQINVWAKDNGLSVLSKIYVPWHWYYFPLCGGFHPANFRVKVSNPQSEKEVYWIAGGGFFWASDHLKIQKALPQAPMDRKRRATVTLAKFRHWVGPN